MKKILLTLLYVIIGLSVSAHEISRQQALQKAQQFMKDKHIALPSATSNRSQAAEQSQGYYIFNAEEGGFVIVSADDRTVPILGYSDHGTFDVNRLPENARKWLEGYEQQIRSLGNIPYKYDNARRAVGTPIAPLITARWNQGAPYNNQCPMVDGQRGVTGCVATAMAQVMYYHKYPTAIVGPLETYTWEGWGVTIPALPATTFKWDKMRDRYEDMNETGKSVDAVAELMRYCGQAVHMLYSPGGSTCFIRYTDILKTVFGYSKSTQELERHNFTTKEWEALIYQELKENRPVIYNGNNDYGGHEFIVDGYDENGLFHVNWGYSGGNDGYFVLSVLNGFDYGVGDTEENGYTIDQRAIVGLQPDHGEAAAPPMVQCEPSPTNTDYTSDDAENFTIEVYSEFFCGSDVTIDLRWVLCQDGTVVKELEPQTSIALQGEAFAYLTTTLSFSASLADGTYELRPMYRVSNTDAWLYCGLYDGGSILLASINGNSLTLKKSSKITGKCQVNSVKLDGRKKTLRGMTATINWTNNGYDRVSSFYVWDGGDEPFTSVYSYLDHHQTEDLNIHFVPKTAGTFTYQISTDYLRNNVIWTSEPQTIEASLPQKLSGEIIIADMKDNTIEGTTIDAAIIIKNDGENAYDDQIFIEIFDADEAWQKVCTIKKDVSLNVGEQKTIKVQFADLAKAHRYWLQARYLSVNEANSRVVPYDIAVIECSVGRVFRVYDMDVDMVVKNANSKNQVDGTTVVMDITLKNNSENDYNDKIDISAYYYNPNNGAHYHYNNQVVFVEVPAGQTITLSNYELTDLRIDRKYQFSISYISENTYKSKNFETYYTMVDLTNIEELMASPKALEVYDLRGRKVCSGATSFDYLPKGVYIINGRKYIK